MSLRTRALVTVGLSFTVVVAASWILLHTVVLPRFDAIEADEMRAHLQRTVAAIRREGAEMEVRAFDWACWDDTYRFIVDRNPAYIESNLLGSTFAAMGVQVIVYADLAGRAVWAEQYDPERQAREPVPAELLGQLLVPGLMQTPESRRIRSGFMLLKDTPVLLVTAPILTSHERGPARGTLLLVRRYDELRVRELARLTRLKLALQRIDKPEGRTALATLGPEVPTEDRFVIRALDEHHLAGHATLADMAGAPAMLLTVQAPRRIHAQGLATGRFLTGALLGTALLSGLVLFVLLSRFFVSPLVRLGRRVAEIGASDDLRARVSAGGRDEIGRLARDIDGMLEQLEVSRARLTDAVEELQRTREAAMRDERFRALGRMASGIGHNINNGLAPVLAVADLLRRDPSLPAPVREQLSTVHAAARGMAATVARLRTFYRPQSDRATFTTFDVNRVVDEVLALAQPRWLAAPGQSARDIEVSRELATGLPGLFGDEAEIREVLTNLVINAVDAMATGGRLTIRSWLIAPAGLGVEVRDTGGGMSPETRERCLEPFFTTKGELGSGLGLAMVHGAARRHDAVLQIDSEPGAGTAVRLQFPVTAPLPAADASAAPAMPAPGAARRVLCIDDEKLVGDTIAAMMRAAGHDVRLERSGEAGVAEFRSALAAGRRFDVVVTDLGMPGMDGGQVARAVKEAAPEVRVILITGWGPFLEDDIEAHRWVDHLLSKPIGFDELRALVAAPGGAAGPTP